MSSKNIGCTNCYKLCKQCQETTRKCPNCDLIFNTRCVRCRKKITEENCACFSCGRVCRQCQSDGLRCFKCNESMTETATRDIFNVLLPTSIGFMVMISSPPPPPKLTVKDIQDAKIMIPDEEDEAIVTVGEKLCIGCCERLPSTVIVDCGHVVYCIKCARRSLLEAISKLSCPICRKEITHGITKIYI